MSLSRLKMEYDRAIRQKPCISLTLEEYIHTYGTFQEIVEWNQHKTWCRGEGS